MRHCADGASDRAVCCHAQVVHDIVPENVALNAAVYCRLCEVKQPTRVLADGRIGWGLTPAPPLLDADSPLLIEVTYVNVS